MKLLKLLTVLAYLAPQGARADFSVEGIAQPIEVEIVDIASTGNGRLQVIGDSGDGTGYFFQLDSKSGAQNAVVDVSIASRTPYRHIDVSQSHTIWQFRNRVNVFSGQYTPPSTWLSLDRQTALPSAYFQAVTGFTSRVGHDASGFFALAYSPACSFGFCESVQYTPISAKNGGVWIVQQWSAPAPSTARQCTLVRVNRSSVVLESLALSAGCTRVRLGRDPSGHLSINYVSAGEVLGYIVDDTSDARILSGLRHPCVLFNPCQLEPSSDQDWLIITNQQELRQVTLLRGGEVAQGMPPSAQTIWTIPVPACNLIDEDISNSIRSSIQGDVAIAVCRNFFPRGDWKVFDHTGTALFDGQNWQAVRFDPQGLLVTGRTNENHKAVVEWRNRLGKPVQSQILDTVYTPPYATQSVFDLQGNVWFLSQVRGGSLVEGRAPDGALLSSFTLPNTYLLENGSRASNEHFFVRYLSSTTLQFVRKNLLAEKETTFDVTCPESCSLEQYTTLSRGVIGLIRTASGQASIFWLSDNSLQAGSWVDAPLTERFVESKLPGELARFATAFSFGSDVSQRVFSVTSNLQVAGIFSAPDVNTAFALLLPDGGAIARNVNTGATTRLDRDGETSMLPERCGAQSFDLVAGKLIWSQISVNGTLCVLNENSQQFSARLNAYTYNANYFPQHDGSLLISDQSGWSRLSLNDGTIYVQRAQGFVSPTSHFVPVSTQLSVHRIALTHLVPNITSNGVVRSPSVYRASVGLGIPVPLTTVVFADSFE